MTNDIFDNNVFEDNHTAISTTENSKNIYKNNTFRGNDKGIEKRSQIQDIMANLPSNTPKEYINELLAILINNDNSTIEQKEQIIKESKLVKFLGIGANISSVVSLFIR